MDPPRSKSLQANDTIWDERSALERLSCILPGFRGYQLHEHRRETDELFRSFGLHRLSQVRTCVEQAKRQLRGRERSPYRGIARRLTRLCDRLTPRASQAGFAQRASTHASTLDALYAQEEDVVRGVVALSVAVHERSIRPEDLLHEIERVERGLSRRSELLASLLA
jgi:hypothetical protein